MLSPSHFLLDITLKALYEISLISVSQMKKQKVTEVNGTSGITEPLIGETGIIAEVLSLQRLQKNALCFRYSSCHVHLAYVHT